ncbi:MAG: desulfoferrodoxin [Candidatus Woesearchaeota archaeon]
MAKKRVLYKCEICGNVVEVYSEGVGDLVCCGEEMKEMNAKTEDKTVEKHVPSIRINGNTVEVVVGENKEHPMEEKHYIEWIQLNEGEKEHIKYLKPNDEPKAKFHVDSTDELSAKEYCNVHGLWKD